MKFLFVSEDAPGAVETIISPSRGDVHVVVPDLHGGGRRTNSSLNWRPELDREVVDVFVVIIRDDQHGPGADEPDPVACITLDGVVVGWVDHDAERSWLLVGAVNVGYNVFPYRGQGIASCAVQLLHHLEITGHCRTATLLIDPANVRSQA